MTIEFIKWPKTPRLFREIIITEKIDGTNSAIHIEDVTLEDYDNIASTELFVLNDRVYHVVAQSRNRLIYPGKTTDNHGFAAWVRLNAYALVEILGEGVHFGEWWGKGIQGRYKGLINGFKGFALFNTEKWGDLHEWLPSDSGYDYLLEAVPVLYRGPFDEQVIRELLSELKERGSFVSLSDPCEGIAIYHTQSRKVYKVTLDGEDAGKWELN